MKSVVLDASVALQWIVKQHVSDEIDRLFVDGYQGAVKLHVPGLWLWECGNVLLTYCKTGWLQEAELEDHLRVLRYPKPVIDGLPNATDQARIAALALSQGLTYYDASYLDLAQRRNASLATLDKQLRKVALACGTPCLKL
jgi:predicted nucleic acid-binding protein